MMFQEAAKGSVKTKPDKQGKVVVRVLLQDPNNKTAISPSPGNLREDIVIESATVGEVAAAVRKALFEGAK